MSDPLAQMIAMLRPGAPFSKLASASGAWRVRRTEVGKVYYCVVLAGRSCLEVEGKPPVQLGAGDFVLIPAVDVFTMSSLDPPAPPGLETVPVMLPDGSVRVGDVIDPPDVQQLIGYCYFGSPDAALLISLLPDMVVVRGVDRLGVLSRLVADEARADRPGREIVLEHLLQVLLIEAFRSASEPGASSGLLDGLADPRLSAVLRAMHAAPGRNWTIAELAREASLSRSAFFLRFSQTVGVAPMDYLLNWRMTLAKDLLRHGQKSIGQIATQIGYGSASAFSTAFSRHVGCPPGQYAQAQLRAAAE